MEGQLIAQEGVEEVKVFLTEMLKLTFDNFRGSDKKIHIVQHDDHVDIGVLSPGEYVDTTAYELDLTVQIQPEFVDIAFYNEFPDPAIEGSSGVLRHSLKNEPKSNGCGVILADYTRDRFSRFYYLYRGQLPKGARLFTIRITSKISGPDVSGYTLYPVSMDGKLTQPEESPTCLVYFLLPVMNLPEAKTTNTSEGFIDDSL